MTLSTKTIEKAEDEVREMMNSSVGEPLVQVALGKVATFFWMSDEEDSGIHVTRASSVWNHFPALSQLLEIEGDTIRWKNSATSEIRKRLRNAAIASFKPIHTYQVPED